MSITDKNSTKEEKTPTKTPKISTYVKKYMSLHPKSMFSVMMLNLVFNLSAQVIKDINNPDATMVFNNPSVLKADREKCWAIENSSDCDLAPECTNRPSKTRCKLRKTLNASADINSPDKQFLCEHKDDVVIWKKDAVLEIPADSGRYWKLIDYVEHPDHWIRPVLILRMVHPRDFNRPAIQFYKTPNRPEESLEEFQQNKRQKKSPKKESDKHDKHDEHDENKNTPSNDITNEIQDVIYIIFPSWDPDYIQRKNPDKQMINIMFGHYPYTCEHFIYRISDSEQNKVGVHQGLYFNYWGPIKHKILEAMEKHIKHKTMVTCGGFSLGGALSQLAAFDIQTMKEKKDSHFHKTIAKVRVISGGAPRVGDFSFKKWIVDRIVSQNITWTNTALANIDHLGNLAIDPECAVPFYTQENPFTFLPLFLMGITQDKTVRIFSYEQVDELFNNKKIYFPGPESNSTPCVALCYKIYYYAKDQVPPQYFQNFQTEVLRYFPPIQKLFPSFVRAKSIKDVNVEKDLRVDPFYTATRDDLHVLKNYINYTQNYLNKIYVDG
jgi:hypothetical protein